MSTKNIGELWVPPGARDAQVKYKKAKPPPLGEKFLPAWGDDNLYYLRMPGGQLLQFDLSKLGLQDYRSMLDHYQVRISLFLLTSMMHQVEWKIECEDKKISEAAEEAIRPIWTRLIRAISQAYWAGYSPVVIQWENDPVSSRVVPHKFKDIMPEDADVNWKKVRGYAPAGASRPYIRVYDGIKVHGAPYPIPAEATLWYPLFMENGLMTGRKLLRTAFPAYFFSQLMHLFSNRYFERFGEPVPIGRAPFDDEVEDGEGNYIAGKTLMEDILRGLRNRSAVVLPDIERPGSQNAVRPHYSYDVQYLESQMRGADFERYLSRLDEEISLALFTPLLMVRTADVGSYNLGLTHVQSWMMMFNSLAGDLKEYIDNYLLGRFVDFNFSPKAPRARWKPKQYGKHETETIRSIVSSVVSGGKAKPDLDELGEAVGMTFEEVKEVTEPIGGFPPRPGDPNNPNALPPGAPGAKKPDTRRPEGRRTDPARPKGTAKISSTRQKIIERLFDQAERAISAGKPLRAKLGYFKEFESALAEEGFADPHAMTEFIYGVANEFLAETHLREPGDLTHSVNQVISELLG